MKPELPKVEAAPLKGEALEGVQKAYEAAGQAAAGVESQGQESQPVRDPGELLKAGSVGVEAGLSNFELGADDGAKSDNSAQSDDDDSDDALADSQTPKSPKNQLGATAVVQTPAIADDKDDIEKEWVSKAKRIVEQTKSDPFLQERAVSRLQADYMKKRFNKEVKLPEEEN